MTFYMILMYLGFSAFVSGISSLVWSTKDLKNGIYRAALFLIALFSVIGFYASLSVGTWKYFNIFSLVSGLIYLYGGAANANRGIWKVLFWMMAIAGIGNFGVMVAI